MKKQHLKQWLKTQDTLCTLVLLACIFAMSDEIVDDVTIIKEPA